MEIGNRSGALALVFYCNNLCFLNLNKLFILILTLCLSTLSGFIIIAPAIDLLCHLNATLWIFSLQLALIDSAVACNIDSCLLHALIAVQLPIADIRNRSLIKLVASGGVQRVVDKRECVEIGSLYKNKLPL